MRLWVSLPVRAAGAMGIYRRDSLVARKLAADAVDWTVVGTHPLAGRYVGKVYPELVIRDEAGKIQGVRYDELAPMLLNEVQKQQRANAAQAEKIASLERQLAGIQAALANLQPTHHLVAQR